VGDVFYHIVIVISGPVLATGWVTLLVSWLRTPPPKAHPAWVALVAIGYAMMALSFYTGRWRLMALAGAILCGVSALAIARARQRQR